MKLSNIDYKLFFGIIIVLLIVYTLGIERFVLEFLKGYAELFVLGFYLIPLAIILLLLLLIYLSIKNFNRPAQQVQIKKEQPQVTYNPVQEAKDNAIILAFSLYFAILIAKNAVKTEVTIDKLISDSSLAMIFVLYIILSTLFYYVFALRMVYIIITVANGAINIFIDFVQSKIRGNNQ